MPNVQNKNKGIEWCHVTWNPLPGECLNIDAPCKKYCYMERLYADFPDMRHPIRINKKEMAWSPQKPMIVFAFSRIEFLHPDMRRDWQEMAIRQMARNPHATYVILSKFPANYANFDWPNNCWLGTTVEGLPHTKNNVSLLLETVSRSYVRVVSYEPLLAAPTEMWVRPAVSERHGKISWAIVGANSNKGAERPPYWWADIIVDTCQKMEIPVFVKSNYHYRKRIKEMPAGWIITDGGLIQTRKPQMELF